MTLQEQLNKALKLAVKAHAGQKDRNGHPYIGHVIRVCYAGHTLREKIAGALHDVVEDTSLTIDDLIREGFSPEITDAVAAMTHEKESESYDDYLQRVRQNPIALRVKINDLTDNMDTRRLNRLSESDFARMLKYYRVYKLLTE